MGGSSTFLDAGLPTPTLLLEAFAGVAEPMRLMLAGSMAPTLERLGLAMAPSSTCGGSSDAAELRPPAATSSPTPSSAPGRASRRTKKDGGRIALGTLTPCGRKVLCIAWNLSDTQVALAASACTVEYVLALLRGLATRLRARSRAVRGGWAVTTRTIYPLLTRLEGAARDNVLARVRVGPATALLRAHRRGP